MRTLALVLGLASSAAAQQDQAARLQKKIEECSRLVSERFVFFGGGSGVMISEDGYCLTNHHVAGTQNSTKVTLFTGKQYTAKLVCTCTARSMKSCTASYCERLSGVCGCFGSGSDSEGTR